MESLRLPSSPAPDAAAAETGDGVLLRLLELRKGRGLLARVVSLLTPPQVPSAASRPLLCSSHAPMTLAGPLLFRQAATQLRAARVLHGQDVGHWTPCGRVLTLTPEATTGCRASMVAGLVVSFPWRSFGPRCAMHGTSSVCRPSGRRHASLLIE